MDTLAGEHFHHWHCQMPSHAAAAPPRWGHLHCARCNCQAKTEERALPWAAPTSVVRLQPGSTPKQPRSWLFRALQPCENGHRTGWGLLSKHRYWERQEPRCVSHRSIPAYVCSEAQLDLPAATPSPGKGGDNAESWTGCVGIACVCGLEPEPAVLVRFRSEM